MKKHFSLILVDYILRIKGDLKGYKFHFFSLILDWLLFLFVIRMKAFKTELNTLRMRINRETGKVAFVLCPICKILPDVCIHKIFKKQLVGMKIPNKSLNIQLRLHFINQKPLL